MSKSSLSFYLNWHNELPILGTAIINSGKRLMRSDLEPGPLSPSEEIDSYILFKEQEEIDLSYQIHDLSSFTLNFSIDSINFRSTHPRVYNPNFRPKDHDEAVNYLKTQTNYEIGLLNKDGFNINNHGLVELV